MEPNRDPKRFTDHFELDYFQRAGMFRNWKWRLSLVAFLVSGAFVAAIMAAPRWHTAFQAAPVAHVHAQFGTECVKCHDQPFATARRFISTQPVASVSDDKCLTCHKTGLHNPHQTRNTGAHGYAAGCTECHKEHRGDGIARLPDATCTSCHADLKTIDGIKNYETSIRHFADGHPEFGHWMQTPLADPAADRFFFNHKAHLELPDNLPKREAAINKELAALKTEQCSYCHRTDSAGRAMKAISFQEHCAICHPITVQADIGTQQLTWELPHPAHGQNAEVVHFALLGKFLQAAGGKMTIEPPSSGEPTDPAVLRRQEELIRQRERVALERTTSAEKQLWDKTGIGCLLCHAKAGESDGLPKIAHPHQQIGRWADLIQSWPAKRLTAVAYADERNRWHPLATFDHRSHREWECSKCHQANTSSKTSDVLIPQRDVCLECHNQSASANRSDCLTCHRYHDRSLETTARIALPESKGPAHE